MYGGVTLVNGEDITGIDKELDNNSYPLGTESDRETN